ncbi:MAG: acriflavin resistance protein [Candidatus Accumulibacter sp. 66-26]|nr:efflux RND transporter permease subunit [Accumulibacter sp.]MBU6259251.1 efflux RND transporter permease subunit [Burkholderiales bacterium]OJW52202.1 MAG: acriflavin resistance protein [Candidatus Accumulibacter sp. 66-26]
MTNLDVRTGWLAAIVGFSLRYRGVVIALAVLLAGYGLYAFSGAKYDVFPEFAPPQVTIQIEAPGLAPEQVEALVTQPTENAINGVAGIESLRSQSIQGLSVITVTFDPKSDIFRDRQNVNERLTALATQLPRGVQAPAMSPLTSSTSIVMAVGLTSEQRSLMDLRTLADWTLKPRLLAVPGVSKVAVFGGESKEFQVQVKPDRLTKYDLALSDVLDVARRATGVRGAGFIDNANQRLVLRTQAQSLTAEELARTIVRQQGGANLTLGDVAEVREAPEPPIGAALVAGAPGVQLVISEQYGANSMAVTEAMEHALDEMRPDLEAQGVGLHGDVFRPANFIAIATQNVQHSLLLGAALVVVVVALFLFNWRTSAIALTAIPLSLLAAVTVLETRGISLNTMTLGGLAIAIGLLVDDAIIVVENIYRRLRENRQLPDSVPVLDVVLDAVLEVRSAVVYATFAIALVFLPVLTLPGIAGRLFSPLGIAYLLATLASLVVAITVTPALCLTLLPQAELPPHDPAVAAWLKERYRMLVSVVERHYRWVVGCVTALTLAGLVALPFFGGSFLPELKEGHYILHMSAVPGTSLAESLRIGRQVTAELLKLPSVRAVSQRVGRAEKADDTWGTHYSEFNVDLKPLSGKEAEFAQADIRNALARIPGVSFAVKTFLAERVEETLSGYTAAVVVNLYGNNLDTLDAEAQRVAQALGQMPGATEVQLQSPPGSPELGIRIRPEALARWGFDAVDVLDAVETAFQGSVVGQVYDGNRVFNVSVILPPKARRSIADVKALPLRNAAGAFVRLDQLADVYATSGRYVVLHTGARRVQTITCNVAGRDVASFVADAKQNLSKVHLSPGNYVEFGGAAAAQAASLRDLLVHSVIAAIAIVLLLWITLGRWRNLNLVLLNLPFALVGGVLAVFGTGGGISLGSLVGFVTLFGITLRNSVMLLSHYDHLVNVEGMAWGPEAALRGAVERLTPILMTALATALGLLPLAIGSGDPGREIEGPMALVILGGLFTSTALNLLVMPSLALRYGRFGAVATP